MAADPGADGSAPDSPAAGPGEPPDYRDVVVRADVGDVRTAAALVALVVLGLVLSTVASRTSVAIALDARSAADRLPWQAILAVSVLAQAVVLVGAVVAPVVLLVRRRVRPFLTGGLAIVLSLVAWPSVHGAVVASRPVPAVGGVEPELADLGPGLGTLAALTAVLLALRPARAWARIWWGLVLLLVVLYVLLSQSGPLETMLSVGVGALVGLVVTLVVGRTVREVTAQGVRSALVAGGLEVTDVRDADGTAPWVFAADAPAGTVLVKVVDRRAWHRERMGRAYRRVRLRTSADEEGTTSPGRAVELEAMLGLLSAAQGAHVPAVRAVVRGRDGEALLVCDRVAGTRLDELPAADVTDEVLRAAWRELAHLRAARVVHRDLSLRHLLLTHDGTVWVTDLKHGEPGAGEAVLSGDVAELLAATCAVVGPERAAAAAHAVLGDGPLGTAVGRLVPAALTPVTRGALRSAGATLDPLVAETCRLAGVSTPTFEKIERVRPRTLVVAGALVVAAYFLAPQLADLPGLVDTVREVDVAWLAPVVLASAATYLGAALGLAGGTPGKVPVGQASAVALASSFVATFAPPGIGQVGLNVRYLQRRGYPTPVAVSASAAKEAAVLCVHLTLLAAFALWAGSTSALTHELDQLPTGRTLLYVGLGLVAVVGAAALVPAARRTVRARVVPAVRASATAMHDVVTRPGKLVALLLGVTLLPLGYAVCLYFSVQAFHGEATFVAVALVSLTAGSVAAAAPIPGGVGAVEAVLVAALTGVGLAAETALAAVVLYRLATFWLPIAPGAAAFRALTRREVL